MYTAVLDWAELRLAGRHWLALIGCIPPNTMEQLDEEAAGRVGIPASGDTSTLNASTWDG